MGSLLLFGFMTRIVALCVAVLMLGVTAWYLLDAKPRDTPCGCYGHLDAGISALDGYTLARNLVIVCALLWLVVRSRRGTVGPLAG